MTHHSLARFAHAEPARLIDFWRHEFAEHDMPVEAPAPGVLVGVGEGMRMTVRGDAEGCAIEVVCDDADWLPDIRSHIGEHLAEFDPALPPLEWSGAGPAGLRPPGFAQGVVAGCAALGRSWWRVTLRLDAPALARFAGPRWHFRLIRPVETGRTPVWPTTDARGAIAWPQGPNALIARVFTTRAVDPAAGTLIFDVFRHDAGPTSDWAATMPVGQPVALTGPGGGGPDFAAGVHVIAGGDETAAPTILRALEAAPSGACGTVAILAGDASDIQPAALAGGLRLRWLLRADGATEDDLVDAMAPPVDDGAARLWFAGSQRAARAVRRIAAARGLPRDRVTASAFWSGGAEADARPSDARDR
jgi:NADPH-dependent ferric siderophore reductase